MREVPISQGFLAFPWVAGTPSCFQNASAILALFVNGSEAFVVTGRDKSATWCSLGRLCRERDWSRQRLLDEFPGLRYRTFPPGHTVNLRDDNVRRSLDVEASTVTLIGMVGGGGGVTGFHYLTVGIEVVPPDAPTDEAPMASAPWAIATTRRLLKEGKIPERATRVKAELSRLLEAEAEKAVRAGKLRRALKATYLEDQLVHWGIWPLDAFE
jgi:hypothetical protein